MKLNELIKRAYEQYKYFMSDEGKRRIAELREKKRLDDLYHRNSALAEGKAEGIVESKFQIAKQLFKMNMKITDISKITNLSETELKKALYI